MNYNEIEEKINSHEYLDAWNNLSEYLKIKPNDLEALFFHAALDFLYLHKNFELDYQELLKIINNKKSKVYNDAMILIIIVADVTYHPETILTYADESINIGLNNNTLRFDCLMDLLYVVSYHFFDTDNEYFLNKGLDYLNILFDKYPDDLEKKHYLLKVLILIRLNKSDEILKVLDSFERNIGACGELYYSKALYHINNTNDELLIKDLLTKAWNYEYDQIKINEAWLDYYYKNKKYNEAEELIKNYLKNNPNNTPIKAWGHQYLLKTYLFDDNLDFYNSLLIIERDLKSGFNPNLKFLKANLIVENYLDIDNINKRTKRINQVINYYETSYHELKEDEILYDLVIFLLHEHKFNLGLSYLNKYYDELINSGRHDYIKAGFKTYLRYNLDEIVKDYELSYKKGYINRLEYLDEIDYIIKNPKKIYKEIQKYAYIKDINTYDAYSARKMGYRFLYGNFGLKKDYHKAKELFELQLKLEPNVACSHTAWGRYLELVEKDYSKAFIEYTNAYNKFLNKKDECSCGVGALANAFVKGIGVDKDIEIAKDIILNCVNKLDVAPVNTVIYLYCYFCLIGDERFNLNKAYELLSEDYPFERYEVNRYMYLYLIESKLNINNQNTLKNLKTSLKYANIDVYDYYINNKDNKELYLFEGSF